MRKQVRELLKQKLPAAANNEEVIHAPLTGKLLALEEVSDEVFRSGAMGKGLAIAPTDNKVYAPFDGNIVMLAPTKHAIGLRSKAGAEVLIHVGLDTVKLNGEPFTLHVKEGDSVKQGDVLSEFDAGAIEAAGVQTITPIIVTNPANYTEIIIDETETATQGDDLLTIVK